MSDSRILDQAADEAAAESVRMRMEDPQGYVELIDSIRYECELDPEDMRYLTVRVRMPVLGLESENFEPEKLEGTLAAIAISSFCHSVAHGITRGRMMSEGIAKQRTGEDN
tara:strand:+ start:619 stop:951 length:333 start_codon:yes stop_codon:yes gene_type:complete